MLLNLDIWAEIIGYFEYPQDEQTLRSIALTSSRLSDLTLGVVWRDGEKPLAIVSVINSFSPSPDQLFLEYVEEYEDGDDVDFPPPHNKWVRGWHLNGEVPHPARKRTLEYLARIKKFHAFQEGETSKADLLWPVLSACLNHDGPLFPNLQQLNVMCSGAHVPINDIISLISPSLRALKIDMNSAQGHKTPFTIINLAKARGCNLQGFFYAGCFLQKLPEAIASLVNLRSVEISGYPMDPEQRSPITLIEFLTSLPSLHSLVCNLDSFTYREAETPSCHTALRTLDIISMVSPGGLHKFFLKCTFPSVVEASILHGEEEMGFEGLELSCPNVRKLNMRHFPVIPIEQDPDQRLEPKHPRSLLPPSSLEVLNLSVSKQDLLPSDLHAFVNSCTNLRCFKMMSGPVQYDFDALPSLAGFSHHPNLDFLYLDPVLFHLLLNDIPKVPDLMRTHVAIEGRRSRLHTLYFPEVLANAPIPTPPMTTAEKRTVAECLHLLFPNLEKLQYFNEYHGKPANVRDEVMVEIQQVLLELRREESADVA